MSKEDEEPGARVLWDEVQGGRWRGQGVEGEEYGARAGVQKTARKLWPCRADRVLLSLVAVLTP